MVSTKTFARAAALSTVVGLSLGTGSASAQRTPPVGDEPSLPWSPISVGVRAGYDNSQLSWLVGGQVRIPVLPNGSVELMPSADITFLNNLTEYQLNAEAVYLLGGRSGGVYGGGGVGLRNSRFPGTTARATKWAASAVVGVKVNTVARLLPQIEVRWHFMDQYPRNLQELTIGASIALWDLGVPPPR